jgi:hypothetical protein
MTQLSAGRNLRFALAASAPTTYVKHLVGSDYGHVRMYTGLADVQVLVLVDALTPSCSEPQGQQGHLDIGAAVLVT